MRTCPDPRSAGRRSPVGPSPGARRRHRPRPAVRRPVVVRRLARHRRAGRHLRPSRRRLRLCPQGRRDRRALDRARHGVRRQRAGRPGGRRPGRRPLGLHRLGGPRQPARGGPAPARPGRGGAADLVQRTSRRARRRCHHHRGRLGQPDGTRIDGLLLRPAAATDDGTAAQTHAGPLPLVLLLHGGPTWLWSAPSRRGSPTRWRSRSPLPAPPSCCPTRAVQRPRPGSCRAIVGRMGPVDSDDVLAGVSSLVATGVADPARMAVLGLSYGGFLSAWLATRTSVFQAAVVMSGVSDWATFARTSNLGGGFDGAYLRPRLTPTATGTPRRTVAGLPLTRLRPRAQPPRRCVLHGAEDQVTPLGQAEQLTKASTAAGGIVELVGVPREGHELVDPATADATRPGPGLAAPLRSARYDRSEWARFLVRRSRHALAVVLLLVASASSRCSISRPAPSSKPCSAPARLAADHRRDPRPVPPRRTVLRASTCAGSPARLTSTSAPRSARLHVVTRSAAGCR